jgi:hypothetical protein
MRIILPTLSVLLAVVLISGCTNAPGTEVDLTGKDYAALVVLGIPIVCDISNLAGYETDATLYIKGEKARAEMSFDYGGVEYESLSVIKDGKVYLQVIDDYFGGMETECRWIYIDTPDDREQASPSISDDDLKALEASEFTCVVGAFGDEMFATTGQACTMAEFMASIMPDLGDGGENYCDYVTDPDLREQLGCE